MPDIKRYARLKALLQEKIISGAYNPGDRFFSQNELMRKYGLSFSTVIRALDELVADGYLIRQQGKGTYVSSTSPKQQKPQSEEKYITIFAPWQISSAAMFGQINAAEFYRHLNDAKPDWMHLRLVPISSEPEALEPWLFSKDLSHAAIALYPSAAQVAILHKMAEQYPVVAMSDEKPIPGFPCAVTSFADASSLAVRTLISQGHTTIALIHPPEHNFASEACLKGYRSALRDAAYPFNEQLLVRCKPSDPTGYNAMLQLFDRNSSVQITSVIAVGSSLLPGVIYAANAMQLLSPEQFATICIDDQHTGNKLADRAARIIFPAKETAHAILTKVMEALEASNSPAEVVIAPEVIPAGTQHNP